LSLELAIHGFAASSPEKEREVEREREREREREILQLRTSSAKMFTSVELIENRKLCPVIMNAVETSC